MLKNVDFISSDTDRKYINALKKKIENATQEERKALYDAYRSVQGFNGPKRKWIETLFGKNIESELVKRINESRPEEKDIILREVNKKVYGSTMDYREVSMQARNIKQYRNEIQEMFMQKLDKSTLGLEDIKTYGLAICDLDSKGKAIPFIKEQMSLCNDEAKQLMFCYVLAVMADSYIDSFINAVLRYDGIKILKSVRNLGRKGKNELIRQCLYSNFIKIKEKYGLDSKEVGLALRNIGEFLQGRQTMAIYDLKFDQILFDFIGYNKNDGILEKSRCSVKKAKLVLGILESVMDKYNYEGRYMKFMWSLFAFFKNIHLDLTRRIDEDVKHLTGQGIPSI